MPMPPINSFIAALIPNAMASCLPLGNVQLVTNTPVHTAANSRLLGMIRIMFAIPTLLLLSLFSNPTQNLAPIARFLFTKLKAVIKCSARNANGFGLGTPASLKLAVTILTTCSGCGKIMPAVCLAIPLMSCVDGKLILASLFNFILKSPLFNTPSWLARHGMMTSPKISAPSLSCSILFLICAFMIKNDSKLIASPSIFPLAKLLLQIRYLLQNSSKPSFAIIFLQTKMNTSRKSFRPLFKPPLTSLSDFNMTFKTIHTKIGIFHLPHSLKNFSISKPMPTMNSHSFIPISIQLLPKFASSHNTISNLSISLNLLLPLTLTLASPSSTHTTLHFADNR